MSETQNEPNIDSLVKEAKPQEKKKKKKKKKLIGFPSIIWNNLKILNESKYFKQKHGNDKFTLLMIATDDRRAALVKVENGQITVESVKNKEEEIKPVKEKVDAVIKTDIETFLKMSMGKINPLKEILKGKLKLKGLKTISRFTKYFGIISHISKEKEKESANTD